MLVALLHREDAASPSRRTLTQATGGRPAASRRAIAPICPTLSGIIDSLILSPGVFRHDRGAIRQAARLPHPRGT